MMQFTFNQKQKRVHECDTSSRKLIGDNKIPGRNITNFSVLDTRAQK